MKIESKLKKIINKYLVEHNIDPQNLKKISKNKYEFEVFGAEKFSMYKLNYKRIEEEGYQLYFGNFSKNIFYCEVR